MKDIFETILNKLIKLPRNIELNPDYHIVQNSVSIKGRNINSKFILFDAKSNKYFLISERESFVWKQLKEDPDLNHLIIEYYRKYKKFAVEFVDSIIYLWSKNGLILNTEGVYGKIKHRIGKKFYDKEKVNSFLLGINKIINIELEIPIVTSSINTLYKLFVKKIFNSTVFQIIFVFSSFLNGVFISYIFSNGTKIPDSFSFITIIIVSLISILFHELGHGFALNIFGHKVTRSGFKLYFFIPVFFVDTTIAWRNRKLDRLKIATAGIVTNWLFTTISFLVFLAVPVSPLSDLLFYFAVINLLNSVVNLIPFIEFDGYYILIDLLNFPNLKNTSLDHLYRFITTGKISRERLPLIVFAILHIVFLLIFIYLSLRIIQNFS